LKTICTLLLKKEVDISMMNWLCTVHIYEADYNILLRWYQITNCQGGGCVERSAVDLAIIKEIYYEVADMMQ